ncbi:hypothetical protein HNY73_007814 [Argiope bruennichi]|uniref:Chitin-binding type-2 domain-containing protein n=2 Tax=Argiope bruennichi TaxID=94029 RepID=A0A8T0FHM2_ARGBR|nr:hypothetical protein HNY73_007814 [Argiope bruennichi]
MSCEVVPGILCPCACRVTTYDDCQSFYHCLRNGKACKKRCPEGLYFNRKRMVCDLPQNVKCRDFFFATLRRLKSQKSDQTLIKYPLETAHFSPDPEILL